MMKNINPSRTSIKATTSTFLISGLYKTMRRMIGVPYSVCMYNIIHYTIPPKQIKLTFKTITAESLNLFVFPITTPLIVVVSVADIFSYLCRKYYQKLNNNGNYYNNLWISTYSLTSIAMASPARIRGHSLPFFNVLNNSFFSVKCKKDALQENVNTKRISVLKGSPFSWNLMLCTLNGIGFTTKKPAPYFK